MPEYQWIRKQELIFSPFFLFFFGDIFFHLAFFCLGGGGGDIFDVKICIKISEGIESAWCLDV